MKKIIITCVFISLVHFGYTQPTDYYYYLPFSGDANEVVLKRSNQNGIVNGAILSQDAKNIANNAYSFDGVDDVIIMPNYEQWPYGQPFTISCWIKPMGNNSISYEDENMQSIIDLSCGNGLAFLFLTESGHSHPNTIGFASGYIEDALYAPNNTIQPNNWYNIVVTYSSSTLKIYVNKTLKATSSTWNLGWNNDGSDLYIGGSSCVQSSAYFMFFKGTIDEYKYFGRTLSAAEVTASYIADLQIKNDWGIAGHNLYYNYGKVGIGTSDPGAYNLNVWGSIRAHEIKVNTTGADFVFSPDYKLRTLGEVENYIKANGHLPEMPKAEEVQKDGVSLGEMQTKLLQKVEELTLYTIELKKENLEQEKRNALLEKKIIEQEAKYFQLRKMIENLKK